jgi:hypothetical protein
MLGCQKLRKNIVMLQSEVSVQPLYDNIPHYLESLKLYESLDFQIVHLFSVTRNSIGVIEYDAIMINNPSKN